MPSRTIRWWPKSVSKTPSVSKTRHWLLWRQSARQFSIFFILELVTVIPLYFTRVGLETQKSYSTWQFRYDCYHREGGWSFVGISLRFGDFNYGSTKALDQAWNWIICRGVQALLMLLAYHVFTDSLLRAAEISSLSFELYAKLSIYSISTNVLWHVLKALSQKELANEGYLRVVMNLFHICSIFPKVCSRFFMAC